MPATALITRRARRRRRLCSYDSLTTVVSVRRLRTPEHVNREQHDPCVRGNSVRSACCDVRGSRHAPDSQRPQAQRRIAREVAITAYRHRQTRCRLRMNTAEMSYTEPACARRDRHACQQQRARVGASTGHDLTARRAGRDDASAYQNTRKHHVRTSSVHAPERVS
jgi:hypothetical protein